MQHFRFFSLTSTIAVIYVTQYSVMANGLHTLPLINSGSSAQGYAPAKAVNMTNFANAL